MMNISISYFDELTTVLLYAILRLRSEVFVKEQTCAYQDLDDKDQDAFHVFIEEKSEIIAYARIHIGEENKISRVVVSANQRRRKLGDQIMEAAISFIQLKNNKSISLASQKQLTNWYQTYGFKPIGQVYLEDGIPHQRMILS